MALAVVSDADAALTAALARALAPLLGPGDTLLLDGPVGAGKTHFARALIQARQGDRAEDVPSPTFTLIQTYEDAQGVEIWHADLYRLTDGGELDELGLEEARDRSICLIEWPDRWQDAPADALRITLAPEGDLRVITFEGPDRWPDLPRAICRARFLTQAGWDQARIWPLAGDASSRRYFRLTGEGGAILMDAAPGSCGPYLAMTAWLRDRHFDAPRIIAQDPAEGLLLIEDFGDDQISRVVACDPARLPGLYARITALLAELHRHAPPGFVRPLDGAELASQVGLFGHYAAETGADMAGIADAIRTLHAQLCQDVAPVTGLRDLHAENIILTPDNRLGLLDFQDAVAVHPAYDLVSLLHDARRLVPGAVIDAEIRRYCDLTGLDPDRFRAAFSLLGAARNLRIMGIFTRLCIEDGKPRYLDFMPHLWTLIRDELGHPALAPLADLMNAVPGPTPAVIERIRSRCAMR